MTDGDVAVPREVAMPAGREFQRRERLQMRVQKCSIKSESERFQSEGAQGFSAPDNHYKRSHNIGFFFLKKKTNVNKVTQHRFLKKSMLSFLYVFPVTLFF